MGDAVERILVTGATGFVPANLVELLVGQGHDVIALHRGELDERMTAVLRAGAGAAQPGEITFVQGDVRDCFLVSGLFREYTPTHVVHAAVVTSTEEVERAQPRLVIETNELSTVAMLAESAAIGVQRFVYLSSASAYAPNPDLSPLTEDAPLRESGGLYGLSKVAAERYCRWARETYGPDVRVVRPGPVYGPWERPTGSRVHMSPVYNAVHLALSGQPIRCNDRYAPRDHVHVHDVAHAISLVLHTPDLAHDIYNIAGDNVTTEALLAAVAAAVPDTSIEWVDSAEDANFPVSAAVRGPLDMSRLRADTGYVQRFGIEDGVAEYVGWVREQG